MRPIKPVKLEVSVQTTPVERVDEFWMALSDFLEAFTRFQIEKLRSESTNPKSLEIGEPPPLNARSGEA